MEWTWLRRWPRFHTTSLNPAYTSLYVLIAVDLPFRNFSDSVLPVFSQDQNTLTLSDIEGGNAKLVVNVMAVIGSCTTTSASSSLHPKEKLKITPHTEMTVCWAVCQSAVLNIAVTSLWLGQWWKLELVGTVTSQGKSEFFQTRKGPESVGTVKTLSSAPECW